MKSIRHKFLKIHGIVLCIVGIFATTLTVIGSTKNIGPFGFLFENKLASVGLFEAYLLAFVCGLFLLLGSYQINTQKWHTMAAIVHLPLLITNVTYWDFYS